MGWGSLARDGAGKKAVKQDCETISHAAASNR